MVYGVKRFLRINEKHSKLVDQNQNLSMFYLFDMKGKLNLLNGYCEKQINVNRYCYFPLDNP